MKDKLRGRFFIFSKTKSEKVKSMLNSKVEGMSTLALNSIMPIVKFKINKPLPLNTLKSIANLFFFILFTYALISIKWIKYYLKREKINFNDLYIKHVAIKERIINGEEEDYKCICTYITIKKRLIGVISYSYRQTKKNINKK